MEASRSLPKVNFIIGAGRSGTTLLLSMLNASDKVLSIPEAPIALYYYHKKKKQTRFFMKDMEDWQKMGRKIPYIRKIEFDPSPVNMIQGADRAYSDYIRASYLTLVLPGKSNGNVEHIVDKTPIYTYYAEELLSLFPEARFVAMMRNPLAQVNSSLENRNPYNKPHSVAFHAYSWQRYADELKRLLPVLKDRLMILKYETLVSEPVATIKKVCDHFSIPYTSDMLEFHTQKQTTAFRNDEDLTERQKDRIQNKYKQLSKPVHEGRKLSWKDKMPIEDQALISDITQHGREFLDYPMDYLKAPKSLQRWWSRQMILAYFSFARRFYHLPIWMRERIRVKA